MTIIIIVRGLLGTVDILVEKILIPPLVCLSLLCNRTILPSRSFVAVFGRDVRELAVQFH